MSDDLRFNPWDVRSLYELQVYDCPECVYQDWSKQSFINHAVKSHPVSVQYLSNIQDNSLEDAVCPWLENVEENNPGEDTFENHNVDIEYQDDEYHSKDPTFDPDSNDKMQNKFEESTIAPITKECFVLIEVLDSNNSPGKDEAGHEGDDSIDKPISEEENSDLMALEDDCFVLLDQSEPNLDENDSGEPLPIPSSETEATTTTPMTHSFPSKYIGKEFKKDAKECWMCEKTFETTLKVIKHVDEIHNEVMRACVSCELMFMTTQKKEKHMRKCGEKGFKCWLCDKSCKEFSSLKSHINGYHRKRANIHACTLCEKSYPKQSMLKTHVEITHDKVNFNLLCVFCGKTFRHPVHLKAHNEDMHPKTPKVVKMKKCDSCEAEFKCRKTLLVHKDKVHLGVETEKVLCPLCGKSFASEYILKKFHIDIVHKGKKPHKCLQCDRAFGRTSELKIHFEKSHATVKKFVCKTCNKNFGNNQVLKDHIKSVHEKIPKHTCDYCGKLFVYSHNYKAHVKVVHHGQKDFKCDLCGMEFVRNKKLQAHIAEKHSNEATNKSH